MTTHLHMILNTFYSGPQAWFFLAADRGYFAAEGLDVEFVEGDTLANAVPRVASGDFDVGYGDLNALIEHAGNDPDTAPVAIFVVHNASPYTIGVAADGPIRLPRELTGRKLLSHPNDAALRMLPEFAEETCLDVTTLTITIDASHHSLLLPKVLAGEADGLFGFVNTLASAAIEAGLSPGAFRHFEWRAYAPDLCGAAVIASHTLLRSNPAAAAGFVRAVNRALKDVVDDPMSGIEAVRRRSPQIDVPANLARLAGTLAMEMAHEEGERYGVGDTDAERLDRAITLITRTKKLRSRPSQSAIFDRRYLPPFDERERRLPAMARVHA